MKKKGKIAIGILTGLAVLVIGIAACMAIGGAVNKGYMSYISDGQRYLETEDYDSAIVAFMTAIDIDDTRTEAYEGLTKAYMAAGYREMAYETLQTGIQKAGSISLRLMMQTYFEDKISVEDTAETEEKNTAEDQRKNMSVGVTAVTLNESLLKFISGATFGDYEQQYGIDSSSVDNGVYTYTVEALSLTLSYSNSEASNIINSNTGTPYREYVPDSVTINNLAYLFGNADIVNYDQLKYLTSVTNLQMSDNKISFDADGCRVTVSTDESGTVINNAWNTITVLDTVANAGGEDSVHMLSGRVIDAANGSGVSDAVVKAYVGYSATGTAEETKTDSQGNYSLSLAGGNYYVTVEKENYITGTFNVYVLSNSPSSSQNFAISTELSEGVIRIVLTWGSSPSDLDGYLVGKTGSGEAVDVNWTSMSSYSSGEMIASLDLDDRNGYGPETITLNDINGTYEYFVVDYTYSGTMSASGAQVNVYMGNSLIKTVNICSGCENAWNVLKISNGEVSVVNMPK